MPIKGKGYGASRPGRIPERGGNTAQGTRPTRTDIGGNTANMGGHKGQQHKFTGGNYIKGQRLK